LTNAFTTINAGNVSVDDGDYFIEYGSEYVIAEYKYQHKNNTDNIQITWHGRSTLASTVSSILLQIYDNVLGGWVTIASETRVPADKDFEIKATQTTNLSNYYDSANRIVVRIYQLVV